MSLNHIENSILESIVVHSDDDPANPEFPFDNPKFPATPTYPIQVPGFNSVWLKDESQNPTGTHKDRMAWEIIVYYQDLLLAKQHNENDHPLPSMSIISSGSAAIAIQTLLARFKLPNLKVLLDINIEKKLESILKALGCEIFKVDLKENELSSQEILSYTDNSSGFDITSCSALNPTTRFYDWLSYEVINTCPDFCFVPFGTGNLFENLLNVARRELTMARPDPRFQGEVSKLRDCHYLGATTANPKSKADKLYAPHKPFSNQDNQWLRFYRQAGYCGQLSSVHNVEEHFLDEACSLAFSQKIHCEPSGIAGLGLLLQMKNNIPKDKKIVIVNTGAARDSLP